MLGSISRLTSSLRPTQASEVTSLLMRVEPTLGVRGLRHGLLAVSEIIRGLELPLRRNNEVYFFECLHALAGRVAAAALPQEDEFELHGQVVARMPKDEEKSNLMLRHWYAADHVKASIRGFLIRKKLWQRFEEREREPSTKRT